MAAREQDVIQPQDDSDEILSIASSNPETEEALRKQLHDVQMRLNSVELHSHQLQRQKDDAEAARAVVERSAAEQRQRDQEALIVSQRQAAENANRAAALEQRINVEKQAREEAERQVARREQELAQATAKAQAEALARVQAETTAYSQQTTPATPSIAPVINTRQLLQQQLDTARTQKNGAECIRIAAERRRLGLN